MFKKYSYEVAISCREHENVANQIGAALRQRKINYYLFTEQRAWGEMVMKQTLDVYTKSRYVLIIVSKDSPASFWMKVEEGVASTRKPTRGPFIFHVYVDTTPDRPDEKAIYFKWANNPGEIAEEMRKRLAEHRSRSAVKWRLALTIVFLISISLFWSPLIQLLTGASRQPNHTSKDTASGNMPPQVVDSVKKRPSDGPGGGGQPPGSTPGIRPDGHKNGGTYLIVCGEVRDADSEKLLDSVEVRIGEQRAFTKNGYYEIKLPLNVPLGSLFPVEPSFSKPGYRDDKSTEAPVYSNALQKHKINMNLKKEQ